MFTTTDNLFISFLTLTLIVGAIIGYFIYSLVRIHRQYFRQLDDLNGARVNAMEEERQAIARDFHDDIGPILSSIKHKLTAVETVSEKDSGLIKDVSSHVESIIKQVMAISYNLVPPSLARKGPVAAAQEFTDRLSVPATLKISITPLACTFLSQQDALHVYRMLQEIIHNTIKHARARTLVIQSALSNKFLYIDATDDGIGFNTFSFGTPEGMGLQNLAVRAKMLDAKLSIKSTPGQGTSYSISIPIPQIV